MLAAIGEIPLNGEETRVVLEEGVGPVAVLIRAKGGKPVFSQLTAARLPEINDPRLRRKRYARFFHSSQVTSSPMT